MGKDINQIVEDAKKIVQGKMMRSAKKDIARFSGEKFREKVLIHAKEILTKLADKNEVDLSEGLKKETTDRIVSDLCGYGSLEQVLEDPYITDIMVNSPSQVFIEKEGNAQRLEIKFKSEAQIKTIIERMMINSSKRINQASPFVDFRLEDGSRVTAVIPPVSKSPTLCIRKFSKERFEPKDLVTLGMLDNKILNFLKACIKSKINILITGSTGAGKTTLLNVLANLVDSKERIVVLEDVEELSMLESQHFLKLLTRPPSIEEKGEIGLDSLVKLSLHLRPDRIIIGEVRGEEAFYFLQAINTGHEGSMCTLHAEHTMGALNRLETLGLIARSNMQLEASMRLVRMGIDLVIHLRRSSTGKRVVNQISEVNYKNGQSVVKNIFLYKEKFKVGQEKDYFEFIGNIPGFINKLEARSGYSKDKLVK